MRIDGAPVPAQRWRRRGAAALVRLLALQPRGRMHRDRAVDALWPDVDVDAALPRLHKAAHFAREALGCRDGVVLRDETVALFPDAVLRVDVAAFDAAADAALRGEGVAVEVYRQAAALYRGGLLPDELGEAWAEQPRLRLRSRYVRLLRGARMWPQLLEADPADEEAHVELLREAVLAGDRAAALRRYERMERALDAELGVAPSPEAVALRERVLVPHGGVGPPAPAVAPRPLSRPARVPLEQTLLERDEDLASMLRGARAAVRTGRGGVVLLTGEAGSGKSSLVRAFVDRLDGDAAVAVGGCDDLLAPRSLGPFRDTAADLPELAWALSTGTAPDDVLPALLRVLAARPSVLVVEDVHWADDATLDAIRYLSRRVPGIPAMLVLTFREEDVPPTHPLRRVLGGLTGPAVRRVELAPLSVAAVRRLAGVDDAEAAEIHRVTRGNAFFVTEVLDAPGGGLPATVRDAVLARVGRLPAPARALADRLAVVPSRAERWLVEALAEHDPAPLTDLERSGVVTGGTEHVAFRHELARRALESSLTVGERVQANREVLAALLRRSRADPSRVVHHAVRAVRTDVLLEYGPVAAADAERQGAHRQAAETLRAVLRHADRLDAATRAGLLTRRAYSLYVVNEYEAALADAEAAVTAAGDGMDAAILGDALTVLSRITFFARGPMTARRAARRAVQVLAGQGDEARVAAAGIELARAHSNLATVGVLAQPDPEVVRHAERALVLADRLRRDDLRTQALYYRGGGRLADGDAGGLVDVESALALSATETRLESRIRAYVNAAGCAYRAGHPAEARRYVAAGLRLAADGEFVAGRYRLHLTSAAMSASTGGWQHAVDELRDLLAGPGNPGVMALLARALLARLLARRGEADAAEVLAGVPDGYLVDTDDSFVVGPLAVARVEVDWLAGVRDLSGQALAALDTSVHCGHTAMAAELCGYLRRAGHPVPVPDHVPGPWAAALTGGWRAAARGWRALGERYEEAVELAGQDEDERARVTGLATLWELGAHATVERLRARTG